MPIESRMVSGSNAGHALLFDRHLAMGGRGGMTGERFRIADIDEPRDQLQPS